jgi:putative ABC transport system ATP-binding protein
MSLTLIEAREVTKHYRTGVETIVAVDSATFSIRQGEFVALMGPSGCGKSTLLGLISGTGTPTAGQVEVLDFVLSDKAEDVRGRFRLANIGMVFQEHNLISEFTSVENVMLPLEVLGEERGTAARKSVQTLDRVGVAGKANAFPDQLSGGQKQRVGIARALIGEKRVLLADEPTGSLDFDNSKKVFELFRSMAADGLAVIVATHDESVLSYATRVMRMRDGRITHDSNLHG